MEIIPIVNTNKVSNLNSTSVTLNGEIINVGYPMYTERGFVYSLTSSTPPTIESSLGVLKSTNSDNKEYYYDLKNLSSNTFYYVRAYVINEIGINYGGIVSFQTLGELAEIQTSAVTDIKSSSATFLGNILKVGSPKYTERGFCYSKSTNPTIEDTKVTVDGSGTGEYSVFVNNLEYNTTYYVRSYLVQNGDVIYGNEKSFTTKYIPTTVVTSGASSVDVSSAILNGLIEVIGDHPVYIERGFCYGTTSSPTIDNSIKLTEGKTVEKGSFSVFVDNLSYKTKYYFRAYAIQNNQVIYGDVSTFTTKWESAIVQTYGQSSDLAKVTLKGFVSNIGNPICSECGFLIKQVDRESFVDMDESDLIPTDRYPHTSSVSYGQYSRTYNVDEEDVIAFCAYVLQGNDIVKGEISYVMPYSKPIVHTLNPSNITSSSMVVGIKIEWQGYPKYTEAGVVVSMYNSTPTINGTNCAKFKMSDSGSAGSLSSSVTGATANSSYYIRAYAISSYGTVYGQTIYVKTLSE